jgi:hypothetical protein
MRRAAWFAVGAVTSIVVIWVRRWNDELAWRAMQDAIDDDLDCLGASNASAAVVFA